MDRLDLLPQPRRVGPSRASCGRAGAVGGGTGEEDAVDEVGDYEECSSLGEDWGFFFCHGCVTYLLGR